jgi:hypothetical protein
MITKIIGLFLFSFYIILVVSCTKTTVASTYLFGIWITQALPYEGKYIEINETELIFGTETGASTLFFIKKIKENKIDKYIQWTFHCTTIDNIPTDIVLFYTDGEAGAHFELRNKREVHWIKLNSTI